MKIVVLAGSPKGEKSVTMQYVNWLRQTFAEHEFEVIQVARPTRKLESEPEEMARLGERVRAADGVLWAFPLYYGLVHAGLKRFIELIAEQGVSGAFRGKHAAILATSIKFFDHTAVEYVRGVSEDLGMSVDEVFSAEMSYLTTPVGQEQLGLFFRKWAGQIEKGSVAWRRSAAISYAPPAYRAGAAAEKRHPQKLGLVTQSGGSANLDAMVRDLSGRFEATEVIDLSRLNIAGDCLGCLHCGYDNQCRYEGRDEVIGAWRTLQSCDAVVFCGFVVDRFFSARWKTFIDRMFFSTHTPLLPGKPLGLVVAGPLRQLANMRALLEGLFGAMQMPLAGLVSDEGEDAAASLETLADSLAFLAAEKYAVPDMFPAISGRKNFRDEIFGRLNFIFPADHRYYKQHGWYDFPHKNIKARLFSFLMRTAMLIPAVRKNVQDNMKENMLKEFQKALKP